MSDPAAPPPPARDGLREALEQIVEYGQRDKPANAWGWDDFRHVWYIARAALMAGQAGEHIGECACCYRRDVLVYDDREAYICVNQQECQKAIARAEALRAAAEALESILACLRGEYATDHHATCSDEAERALAKLRAGLGEGAGGG